MYYSVKQYLLLMGCLYLVTQTRGHEDQLSCGRRKVQTNSTNNNGDAIAGHWPWYAAIYHRKGEKQEYACGGSILDETTILTASNCVYTPSGVISAALVTVHVGQIHPKQASAYAQTYGVREIVVHPGFSEASTVNDIALIKLTASITLTTEYVQPVCLWTMDSALELIVGRNGTVVGFGPNEQRDAVSKEQLQQATIGVVDPQTCIASDPAVFGTHLPVETFCGKGRQNGVGTCNGDSGDGLFFEVSGRWFVRGLVARLQPVRGSDGLCDPLQYTVYTDVAKYVQWIKRYVDPRVLPGENGVLTTGVDYEEQLRRLFNFDSCGLTSSVALYGQHNLTLPWLGEVMVPPNADSVRCIVTLISDRYAVGPAHCFVGSTPYISLDGVVLNDYLECYSNGNESSTCTAFKQRRKIQRVIVHPNYGQNNSTDNIALIELLSPANTSHPNVLPICMPVMPELRTQTKTNLHVATAEMHGAVAKNVPVRYLEPDECTKVYAEVQIVLNLDLHKRLCAVIERWEDEEACKPLVAGAPLQETKRFRGKEQYVLRGFELAGMACRSSAPAIYLSIEPYVDWILYNMMRYNVVEETDVPDAEITPPTLESEWNKLQQQPGSDNLQLFNLDTCGLFSLESNSQTGKEATFAPWIVSFDKVHKRSANVDEVISSTAVLISEWYALAAKTSVQKNVVSRYLVLGVGSHFDTFFADIKNIILPPPDHPRQLFALIELLEPADLTIPHIKPICLPFLDGLHRNKPAEVILSTRLINSFKKLKTTDYQRCLRRLLYIDQPITFDTEPSCAVEDLEDVYQASLASDPGSPFQSAVWYGERPRYFLYGMHVNESSIFSTLHHGPYLFHKIEQADVAWIMENVRKNERQSSFPSKVRNERVTLNPVQRNASRRALLKINGTCGVSTNRYPTPWIVALVNKPSFGFPLGYVTLISDRYVVGPVYACDGDASAVCPIFVRFDGLPEPFIAIDKVFVHPRHDAANHANDIALARLVAAVDTSLPNVQPICLPISDTIRSYDLSSLSMDYYDSSLWGYNVVNAGDRYIDHTDCQQRWEGLKVQLSVDRTNHCVTRKRTIEEDALIDIRIGFALHSRQSAALSEREYLRGFAVFKAMHAKSYYPDVYINTDAYLDWILDTMEQRPALPFDLREKLIFSDK